MAGELTTLAVRMLTTVLHLPPDAPPVAVAQAVQDATPDEQLALRQADDTFRAHAMDLAAQAMAGQVDISKLEAGNASFFVAGARPMILWILATALAWGVVVVPVVGGVSIFLRTGLLPPPDLSVVLALLTGMLGLSGIRSYDKAKGTATTGFGSAKDRAPVLTPQPLPVIVPVAQRQLDPPPAAPGTSAAAPPIFVQRGDDPPSITLPEGLPAASDELNRLIDRLRQSPARPATQPVSSVTWQPAPRKDFFDTIRMKPFGGHLVQSQVEGINRILDYWDANYADSDPRFLAYALATAWWETGHAMQPVEEVGRGAAQPYGKTGFWGRGLAQLTHQENYARLSPIVGVDLVAHPDAALTWPVALPVLFEGMMRGLFTGKKLADFFNDTSNDAVGARAVVNGSDHAAEVAGVCATFYACLPGRAVPSA